MSICLRDNKTRIRHIDERESSQKSDTYRLRR